MKLEEFFHRFPHIDINFHRVSPKFDLSNQIYLESLSILASFPALILIFILFILLLYLLTRCCNIRAKRKSFVCLKLLLAFLGLVCCASIGLGLYGNDDFHNGIEILVQNLTKIRSKFSQLVIKTSESISTIENRIFPLMSRLGVVFERPLNNESAHIELLSQMTKMESNVTITLENSRKLSETYTKIIHSIPPVQIYEAFRWPITLGMLILFIIFCVVLFYAIVRHSRCCFITFSVLGLIAIIINWSLVSLYLVGAVALADACVSPQSPVLQYMDAPPLLTNYYLNCNVNYNFIDVQEGVKSIEGAQHTLRVINSIAGNYYSHNLIETHVDGLFRELYQVENSFNEIKKIAKCEEIKQLYDTGRDATCHLSLFGLSLLLLSSIFTSLLFTLLVGFDSHTWIYLQKRKHQTTEESILLPYNSQTNSRRSGGAGMTIKHPWVTPTPPTEPTMASTRL